MSAAAAPAPASSRTALAAVLVVLLLASSGGAHAQCPCGSSTQSSYGGGHQTGFKTVCYTCHTGTVQGFFRGFRIGMARTADAGDVDADWGKRRFKRLRAAA